MTTRVLHNVKYLTTELMKRITSLMSLMLLAPVLPAEANNFIQPGGTRQETCYTNVYREEYIPGTQSEPGRVRSWTERQEVPCEDNRSGYRPEEPRAYPQPVAESTDDNSCIEGSIIGALLGGGIGGAVSRGEGRWVAVPGGAVAGALIGCQIDGG